MQRQYGKTEKELETLVDGFIWALEGYLIDDVMKALKHFVRADPNIPTPSDVIKIIEGWRRAKEAEEYYNKVRAEISAVKNGVQNG